MRTRKVLDKLHLTYHYRGTFLTVAADIEEGGS